MGFGEELRLLWFLCLNGFLLGSCGWVAWRRGMGSRSRAALDALLLYYLVQYSIVCGLGLIGYLSPVNLTIATAGTVIVLFLVGLRRSEFPPNRLTREGRVAMAILVFAVGFLIAYAIDHRYLPVLETDALAYHLPTAIGWLQSGRLKLFSAWYWNPANSWSPLGAEAFMAWLIAPMQGDVFVRYVQVPALLMIGLAMYRIGRQLRARPVVAACVAVATILSRSIFAQATLVKDDLFVAAFFIAAVAALGEIAGDLLLEKYDSKNETEAPNPKHQIRNKSKTQNSNVQNQFAGPRFGFRHLDFGFISDLVLRISDFLHPKSPSSGIDLLAGLRVGVAVGLLIATKYPALLTLPLLLLMMPSVARAWSKRQWFNAIFAVLLLAGPWFVRNWIEFGNPLFPMIIKIGRWTVFHGIFNVTRAASTRTPMAVWSMVTGGYFGTPPGLLVVLIAGWAVAIACAIRSWRSVGTHALSPVRGFVLAGPIVGPVVFSVLSPHPEIRYFFPFLLPFFAVMAAGLRALDRWPRLQITVAAAFAAGAAMTSFRPGLAGYTAMFIAVGILLGALGWVVATLWSRYIYRLLVIGGLALIALAVPTYINWRAYLGDLNDAAAVAWANQYGPLGRAWIAARDQLPPTATIGYANTYLIYPLFGSRELRRIVYVPTRPGETKFADLPRLGDKVPQTRIVAVVTAAMNTGANKAVWLENLHRLGVDDVFIAKHQIVNNPPELRFAQQTPTVFKRVFENEAAVIYEVKRQYPSAEMTTVSPVACDRNMWSLRANRSQATGLTVRFLTSALLPIAPSTPAPVCYPMTE